MKFKKCSFICLAVIFILSIFGIFPHVHALNYKFNTNCETRNLSDQDPLTINLNLNEGYGNYLHLNPFILKIKFNNDLFEFKGITTSKNIRRKDIAVENSDNAIKISFISNEPRIIPFSNNFAEILKANFTCKSDISCCQSYFQTEVIDGNTGEQLLSDFSEVTIKNNPQNNIKATNTSTKYSSNTGLTDCRLKSVVPNIGILNPSFDPNTLKYKMEVPKETQEVYFDIVPISENTNVRVNRHRLSAPGTITYINITSKNKSNSLSYLIEVKRSINPSTHESSDKISFKISSSVKVRGKIKSKKFTKSKHKRNKTKGEGKSSDDTDEEEFDEDEINEESNTENNKSSSIKNNKVYSIVILVVLILSVLTYLLFKKKLWFQKNKDNTSENDINNFFKK